MSDLNSNALTRSINVDNHNYLPVESCDSWLSSLINLLFVDRSYFLRYTSVRYQLLTADAYLYRVYGIAIIYSSTST